MAMDFIRHLRPEYSKKKRAAKSNALGLFQSVELSLLELLPSRAQVRFTQHNKIIFLTLTQFIEHSLYKCEPLPKIISPGLNILNQTLPRMNFSLPRVVFSLPHLGNY